MTRFTKKAAMFILSVAVMAGCKKDDNKNSSKSKTELLTSGSWKQTSIYFTPAVDWDLDGHTENEVINLYPPCSKDDLLTFKTNGTAVSDEGASKCDPSDPQVIETTNWKFSDNETKIMIGDPGAEETAQLLELSSTVLKVKITMVEAGVTYTETLTFGH
ncbi:lipocalin family protein [Pinibacter aurantiacus]|uniref:Lipocalin family protein n=1 Tax=Pinibacter aurantiacus TaxID=2851599 RepID=A0A9E2W7Q4_9BACT|nr:lipocalin family protein [Pinibacter aurantiacus]MBV4357076.1 lipocalin family protein [Pinibacter aurantiacus]